ncbi:nuclear transport factor 2 family protein [Chitinophaga sp. Cy-1792]|uniref:nuclear transport factor 2 family protein n=1 Tax=Chitinophaga sp. Cy-1792 TaxID=2608339 RepID=UPI00142463C3|nr:nuclear transport factor 2 family protein [Chitinophaga sp. Cy-1792]NIG52590.1 nuclear transport factor 2 family protein [Chitinophaga sp. Cy-1792]
MKSPFALLLLCLGISINLMAQNSDYKPKDPALYNTIAHMDSVMFNAFNNQDISLLRTVFAENVEFYNDGGGVSDYNTTIRNFEAMFQRNRESGLKRTLVPGSLEVYPVPGFGAIETGLHRFTHIENGKTEEAVMKFVQIWQFRDNQWKATRVISIGH